LSFSLTQAYLISFILLAMWAFFGYLTMHKQISAQEKYAELINVSGRQRMLSQRTALLTLRVLEFNRNSDRAELLDLKRNMEKDHLYLLSNLPDPSLYRIYFADPYLLNERTEDYFNQLDAFIQAPAVATSEDIFRKSAQLLPELDNAVQVWEDESDKKTKQLMRLEGYILLGTILTLVLEAVFILRPTLRRANLTTSQLQRLVREKTKKLTIYQMIFANSNDGIMITDSTNAILEVNPAFSRVTGYKAGEVVGEKPVLLKSTHLSDSFYRAFWDDLYRKGYWSGEFINRKKDGSVYHQFTYAFVLRDEQDNVKYHIAIICDVSASKADRQRLEYLALYDMLTGVPNRAYLTSQLSTAIERSKRYKEKFALILVDLDNFKWINDTLSHRIGDIVLQEVANILKNSIRSMDTVCRIGGDEFVLLIEKINLENSLAMLLEKILEEMSEPLQVDEHQISITCSMGVAIYPDDAETQEELMKVADTAMYCAKHTGKNQFSFFTQELNLEVQEQARIEHGLQQAIAREEFSLLFLPVFCLEYQNIAGYEALLRWNNAELGPVEPVRFLPVAEAMGYIKEIDFWMLHRIRNILEQDENGTWGISVNISTKTLAYKDFVEEVREVFRGSSVCHRIVFDIPEIALLAESLVVGEVLTALAAAGFKFAVDNFGTGYASIRELQRLPVDFLKIDKTLIQEVDTSPDARKIVRTVMAMGKEMSIQVIAAGIETEGQLSFLQKAGGCRYGQGYFFSEPVSQAALHPVVCEP